MCAATAARDVAGVLEPLRRILEGAAKEDSGSFDYIVGIVLPCLRNIITDLCRHKAENPYANGALTLLKMCCSSESVLKTVQDWLEDGRHMVSFRDSQQHLQQEAPSSQLSAAGEETENAECDNESRGKKRLRGIEITPAKEARARKEPTLVVGKLPNAFDVFAEEKWCVLVGGDVDRRAQAALMWKALPANEHNYCVAKAKAIRDKYNLDMQLYRESLPPKEKTALQQKDKQKEKEQALRQNDECKDVLKQMGVRLKGCLVVRKSIVPPGSFTFTKIDIEKFDFIFGKFRSSFSPSDWTVDSPNIVGTLSGDDPMRIFGKTNTTHKGWADTFVVHKLTVTYDPITAELNIAYATKVVRPSR